MENEKQTSNKWKVVNVKTGHSVNSSSSHSLVIVKNPGDYSSIHAYDEDYFGWGDFLLTEKSEKMQYLVAMINSQYYHISEMIFTTLTKLGLLDSNDYCTTKIDHDSVVHVPGIEVKGSFDFQINENEFKNFLEAYLSDNVLVLGGNDNETCTVEVDGSHISFDSLSMIKNGNTVCFFDSPTGTRVTLSQEDDVKLDYPMLVDLKITDYCAIKNCGAACYQNSTEEGQHCSMNYINKVVDFIKKGNVLEVAIGGGEPTHHPNFKEIISLLTPYTNVNFTTRNKEFLINTYLKEKDPVFKNVGFALSIDSISDIDFLFQFLQSVGSNRVNAQYIVGQHNEKFFASLLEKCNQSSINLILLGWKTTGRGNTRVPFNISNPYKHIMKYINNSNISVDTSFFSIYGHGIIPQRIKITNEGIYSSYIDCVEKKLYKSSYQLEEVKDFSDPASVSNFFDYSSIDKKRLNVISAR